MDLERLKLELCDLTGTSTVSAAVDARDQVVTRTLGPEELWIRRAGRDWPPGGVSMLGLERLSDLQRCLTTVVADDVPGDVIETGCWRGGAMILARAVLNELGETDRTVWAADSFEGFRPDSEDPWEAKLATWRILDAPFEDVKANFERFGVMDGVRFLKGVFEETLPTLRGSRPRQWSVIRIDGDTYSSTWTVLSELYDDLAPAGFVIVDDYRVLPPVRGAVDRFRRERGIADPLVEPDSWNSVRWRRLLD